jgi:ribulose-5-phosphate 4-epimerase/fuculose-1-phosphate aldolase
MIETEGVIQFTLEHTRSGPLDHPELTSLAHWHGELHKLGLISQDSKRYAGYAYGNMSIRTEDSHFIISGTQTGGLDHLDASHYALVTSCDISNNTVVSLGPVKPSSECMSHAAVYMVSKQASAVVHVHSPSIWRNHEKLGLFAIAANITYGTVAMANAIRDYIKQTGDVGHGCIVMLGHEDGVIAWAGTVEEASKIIIHALHETNNQFN